VKHATRPGTVYGTPARVVSLHCISPVMARSERTAMSAIAPLSGVQRK
jgi:hypothetical protein